jgi:transcriptional regulator with XRE-family HTH domain
MSLLKDVISENGKSQAWVAEKMGVKPATVSGWVNADFNPSPERYEDLARLLDLGTGKRGRKALMKIITENRKELHGRSAA